MGHFRAAVEFIVKFAICKVEGLEVIWETEKV